MQVTLSILLPVYNAQHTLVSETEKILEVAGELTDSFELLIIDNGSTDHTLEVAYDQANRYPQVKVMRHNRRRRYRQAIVEGLRRARGHVVVVRRQGVAGPTALSSLCELKQLWDGGLKRPQPVTAQQHNEAPTFWQIMERPSVPQTRLRTDASGTPRRPNFLSRFRDFAVGE